MSLESNPKREQIIQKGRELFWKFGIKRVTIEEICREAGVSKMTFYKYFSNKVYLAVLIFRQFYNKYYDYFERLFESNIRFEEKLSELINIKLEAAENMSMEMVRDMYQSDIPELIKLFEDMQKKSFSMTLNFIAQGKKEGCIRKDFKNDFILFQLNHMIEWMRNDELLALYSDSRMLTKNLFDYFFHGILTREN